MSFKELVGKKVENIAINEDDDIISFLINVAQSKITENQRELKCIWPKNAGAIEHVIMKFSAQGECCNTVWIESWENIDLLIGSDILSVEEKGWQEIEDKEHEVLEAGFWTIKTSRGYVDIEVRNSHNGYYGGCVSFAGLYTNDFDFENFQKETDSHSTKNQKQLAVSREKSFMEEKTPINAKKFKAPKI